MVAKIKEEHEVIHQTEAIVNLGVNKENEANEQRLPTNEKHIRTEESEKQKWLQNKKTFEEEKAFGKGLKDLKQAQQNVDRYLPSSPLSAIAIE